MTKVVRLLSVAVIAFRLTACGKSKEEKAQDRAQADVEEQNRLANEINASGVPSSSWSEESLARLENKLLQLEQVESRLASANGNNGVTIYGANNGRLISQLRQRIADARAEKARAQVATVPTVPSTSPTTAQPGYSDEIRAKVLNERLKAINSETVILQSEFGTCDLRLVDASASEIRRCLRVVESLEKNIGKTRDIYTEMQSLNGLPYSLRQDARRGVESSTKLLGQLNTQKNLYQVLLSTKEQAS